MQKNREKGRVKKSSFVFLMLALLWASVRQDVLGADSSVRTETAATTSVRSGIFLDPAQAGPGEVWDVDEEKAAAFPHDSPSQGYLNLHGNGFFEAMAEEGPDRGRADFSAPNRLTADLGIPLGSIQFVNLEVALTSDLALVPQTGTPQIFQIGENQMSSPFVDAQAPNRTPLSGLTLSDTLALDSADKSCLKIFAAPRGQSTEGPIAYFDRLSGIMNPDRPLGDSVGQGEGIESSMVIGGALELGGLHIETSMFNGMESNPTQVDLPIGTPDSYAIRLIQVIDSGLMLMASYADAHDPEPGIADSNRYSVSLYTGLPLSPAWTWHNTLVYGGITNMDNAAFLNSALEEFTLINEKMAVYGRFEAVQRTPNQLGIPGLPEPDTGRWVTALTLGYSHQIIAWDGWELRAGAEVANSQTPADYSLFYAGNPFSYKFFFQLGGFQSYGL